MVCTSHREGDLCLQIGTVWCVRSMRGLPSCSWFLGDVGMRSRDHRCGFVRGHEIQHIFFLVFSSSFARADASTLNSFPPQRRRDEEVKPPTFICCATYYGVSVRPRTSKALCAFLFSFGVHRFRINRPPAALAVHLVKRLAPIEGAKSAFSVSGHLGTTPQL